MEPHTPNTPPAEPIDEEAELLKLRSRRRFLGAAGVGAGAIVVGGATASGAFSRGGSGTDAVASSSAQATNRATGTTSTSTTTTTPGPVPQATGGEPLQAQSLALEPNSGPDRFVRIFNDRDLNRNERDEMVDALVELSQPGGILDAGEPATAGALALLTDPELTALNPDNPTMNAGATFFGQFVDHDLTLDADSRLGRPTGLRRSVNMRTARLDLDSVYGGGPDESPDFYDDNFRFIVESGGIHEDLPRDADGVAIIGDPRNDENLIISGLHAAFLLFHNNVMDLVEDMGLSGEEAFLQARQLVRWHYQWILLHEFLPMVVGQEMIDDVLSNGRRFYTTDNPRIPVEFQTSAYRFGHSLVRASYQANSTGDDGQPFIALVFDMTLPAGDDPDDLRGGHRAPRRYIDWEGFFDFDGVQTADRAKQIDTKITSPLFRLPSIVLDSGRNENLGPASLATRNLLRHLTWEVATGQQVANQMGIDGLSQADLALFDGFGGNLVNETPLWLYILREAEVVNDGTHLGPVGGRIVAEVFVGLLEMDSASILNADGGWTPTLQSAGGADSFVMADLLTIAGVDPASRRA